MHDVLSNTVVLLLAGSTDRHLDYEMLWLDDYDSALRLKYPNRTISCQQISQRCPVG
jgi:hypothetical protein